MVKGKVRGTRTAVGKTSGDHERTTNHVPHRDVETFQSGPLSVSLKVEKRDKDAFQGIATS